MVSPEVQTSAKVGKTLRWRFLLLAVAALAAVSICALCYIGRLGDNFRVVSPGKVYRSAQMAGRDLRAALSAHGIKTVVNLRGQKRDRWYATEVEVAEELGLKRVDIALSAEELPPPDKLVALLDVFAQGPYPMLIHCWAGSDRSGLASVIYRVVMEHAPLASALKDDLTWRYGHFAWSEAHAMDDFFELYRQTGRGKDLAQWIREDYPELYEARMRPPAGSTSDRPGDPRSPIRH